MFLSYEDLKTSDELYMRSRHNDIFDIKVNLAPDNSVVDIEFYFTVQPLESYNFRELPNSTRTKRLVASAFRDFMELVDNG